ncbi:MAG: putative DNA binding domain-containing protein [Candidatus Nanoarchaeia archaeon]|nr:putative DNA binding domain-containing protein [Candidatus Nanoarchaeia archaeon]
MDSQYTKNIEKELKVEILTDQNQILKGTVDDILTKDRYHIKGVKVRLKNGGIGRVQRIFFNDEQKNKKNLDDTEALIKNGENFFNEFKLNCSWSENYSSEQINQSKSPEVHNFGRKACKVIIAKSIASFLNSSGGNLIIGIKEKKEENKFEIIGIDEEIKSNNGKDGYKRMILDNVIRAYFPPRIYNHLNDYISINFTEISGKTLCLIKIKKSESKVFLKLNDKEVFVIRVESENRVLEGEKMVDYCVKHFK